METVKDVFAFSIQQHGKYFEDRQVKLKVGILNLWREAVRKKYHRYPSYYKLSI